MLPRLLFPLSLTFSLLLAGCSGVVVEPEPETFDEAVPTVIEAPPEPHVDEFLEVNLVMFEVDNEGSRFIDGYLFVEYEIRNLSGKKIEAIAATLTVESTAGELLYSENLNSESGLAPGAAASYGLYGDQRAPLLRRVSQWELLLDLEDPGTDAVVNLEIRKLMFEDGDLVVFREDVPEGIKIEVEE